jgi:hypothetical protein
MLKISSSQLNIAALITSCISGDAGRFTVTVKRTGNLNEAASFSYGLQDQAMIQNGYTPSWAGRGLRRAKVPEQYRFHWATVRLGREPSLTKSSCLTTKAMRLSLAVFAKRR